MADTPRLDEDEPTPLAPSVPPEIASPLAPFHGESPPSPVWFTRALARAPERTFTSVLGASIETLAWGEMGKPGLVFVHGNTAHADWWSFIAPFFADDWRVAALSLSGMGASDWRERYSFETFASEIHQCAKAAGLYEAPQSPVYVGHSFGGSQVYYSACRHPDRMRACVLVDTGFGGPPSPEQVAQWQEEARRRGEPPLPGGWARLSQRAGRNRVYATLEEALARFRFMPPQVPGNLYIADFIARRSLRREGLPDGGEGWTWRFDPALWSKLDRVGMDDLDIGVAAPLAHIWGDRSDIIRRNATRGPGGIAPRDLIPPGAPHIVIPDSEHHIMVDQPLALVSALRALLAAWPAGAGAA